MFLEHPTNYFYDRANVTDDTIHGHWCADVVNYGYKHGISRSEYHSGHAIRPVLLVITRDYA